LIWQDFAALVDQSEVMMFAGCSIQEARRHMGLLGQILGEMTGQTQAPPAQMQAGHSMLESVLQLVQNHGGVGGLMSLLEQKGFGQMASGWVSNGPNPPISPSQLTSAIGDQPVQQFAQQNGLSQSDAASTLARLLPHVVDQMTPNGQVPQQGMDMGAMLSMLKSKLM
jgi:uncharacterized protein YidB (DUF937 family)